MPLDAYPRKPTDYNGPRVTSTESFIQKAKFVWGDTYCYRLVSYVSSREKISIECMIHGVFQQSPADHLAGNGCTKCRRQSSNQRRSMTVTGFISRGEEKHDRKFDYSEVNYVNYNTKVSITCPIHGRFQQTPGKHLSSRFGCPKCGIAARVAASRGDDSFIDKANRIHNGFYDYSAVNYTGAHNHITIICPVHGKFIQSPTSHLGGNGCPLCARRKETHTKISQMSEEEKQKKHYLYIIEIRCNYSGERFHKVGSTHHSNINRRYPPSRYQGFTIDVLYQKQGQKENILTVELDVLERMEESGARYKLTKYKERFAGWTECYHPSDFDPLPHISSMA